MHRTEREEESEFLVFASARFTLVCMLEWFFFFPQLFCFNKPPLYLLSRAWCYYWLFFSPLFFLKHVKRRELFYEPERQTFLTRSTRRSTTARAPWKVKTKVNQRRWWRLFSEVRGGTKAERDRRRRTVCWLFSHTWSQWWVASPSPTTGSTSSRWLWSFWTFSRRRWWFSTPTGSSRFAPFSVCSWRLWGTRKCRTSFDTTPCKLSCWIFASCSPA